MSSEYQSVVSHETAKALMKHEVFWKFWRAEHETDREALQCAPDIADLLAFVRSMKWDYEIKESTTTEARSPALVTIWTLEETGSGWMFDGEDNDPTEALGLSVLSALEATKGWKRNE